jgi:hypothetical protein
MNPMWRRAPVPFEDELLSSYLVRVAHCHGVGAYSFYSYHLPKTAIWARDIDRSVSDSTLQKISVMSGLSFERLKDMTLQSNPYSLHQGSEKSESCRAVYPWLNAMGIYHNTRRRFGLQFCPHCINADPFYKKPWRVSLVTVCPQHCCNLFDACPRCGAPVIPHRNHVSLLNCHKCQRPLTKFISSQSDSVSIDKRLKLQNMYLNSGGNFFSINAAPTEIFSGVHALLGILRKHRSHSKSVNRFEMGAGPIELLRLNERANVSLFIYALLDAWPNSIREIANELKLNQRHVGQYSYPSWIKTELDALPQGKPKTRKEKSRSVLEQLKSVQRHKPEGWRSTRAQLLLKMTKEKL